MTAEDDLKWQRVEFCQEIKKAACWRPFFQKPNSYDGTACPCCGAAAAVAAAASFKMRW
jgi:hypothetical protein